MIVLRAVKATVLGKIFPMLVAYLYTACGLYIYKEIPSEIQEGHDMYAAFVFRAAVLILLWRLKVYPQSLKRMGKPMQYVLEFFLCMFVVEYLQADFWVPLHLAVKVAMAKLSEKVDSALHKIGLDDLAQYAEYIGNETTITVVIYLTSLFFLQSVMHATRLIDLRLMKYGPEPFIVAIRGAIKKFKKFRHGDKNKYC